MQPNGRLSEVSEYNLVSTTWSVLTVYWFLCVCRPGPAFGPTMIGEQSALVCQAPIQDVKATFLLSWTSVAAACRFNISAQNLEGRKDIFVRQVHSVRTEWSAYWILALKLILFNFKISPTIGLREAYQVIDSLNWNTFDCSFTKLQTWG